MAGVIDSKGVQWEHCGECRKWVRFDQLWYEHPTEKHKHGRDLCSNCARIERILGKKVD